MEDDVDVWRYAIVRVHARNGDDDECWGTSVMPIARAEAYMVLLKELGYTVTDQHKHHQSQKYISSCTQIKGRAKAAAKSYRPGTCNVKCCNQTMLDRQHCIAGQIVVHGCLCVNAL